MSERPEPPVFPNAQPYWPPRGEPARGEPASGPGWGGPAKGASAGPGAEAIRAWSELTPEQRRARVADKNAQRERMHMIITDVAETADHAMVRLQAADRMLDRIDGKPVARNINVAAGGLSDLDPETVRRLARRALDRAAGLGGKSLDGAAAPSLVPSSQEGAEG